APVAPGRVEAVEGSDYFGEPRAAHFQQCAFDPGGDCRGDGDCLPAAISDCGGYCGEAPVPGVDGLCFGTAAIVCDVSQGALRVGEGQGVRGFPGGDYQ